MEKQQWARGLACATRAVRPPPPCSAAPTPPSSAPRATRASTPRWRGTSACGCARPASAPLRPSSARLTPPPSAPPATPTSTPPTPSPAATTVSPSSPSPPPPATTTTTTSTMLTWTTMTKPLHGSCSTLSKALVSLTTITLIMGSRIMVRLMSIWTLLMTATTTTLLLLLLLRTITLISTNISVLFLTRVMLGTVLFRFSTTSIFSLAWSLTTPKLPSVTMLLLIKV